jgi:hypothetical protein
MSNLPQKLIIGLLLLLAIPLAVYIGTLCGEENIVYLVLIIAVILGVIVLVQPVLLVVSIPILYQSGLQLPGLGMLNLFYIAILALGVVVVARSCMRQNLNIQINFTNISLAVFLLVVVMTMVIRGSGFRFLGSSAWGGFAYVQVLSTGILALLLPLVPISPKLWRVALLGMGIAAFLPAIVEALMLKSQFFYSLALFIKPSAQIGASLVAEQMDEGIVRYFSFGLAALLFFLTVSACVNVKRFGVLISLPYYLLFFACMGVAAFSGFRSRIIVLAVFFAGLMYLSRAITVYKVMTACCAGILVYMTLFMYVDKMPLSMQRTVSFVPGIKGSVIVSQDAQGTVEWRLELWKMGWKTLPKYWLVGKGYAFNANEMDAALRGVKYEGDLLAWAMVSGSYHNGPLSLLLGLGIFGLLSGLFFLFMVIWRHWIFYRNPWQSERLRLMHLAFYTYFIINVGFFLLFYGDVIQSYPEMFFTFAILESLVAVEKRLKYRNDVDQIKERTIIAPTFL